MVLLIGFSASLSACAAWTKTQQAEFIAFAGLAAADAGESASTISRRHSSCTEADPIVVAVWGTHPSVAAFAINTAVGVGAVYLTAEALPGHWRDLFLWSAIGMESYFVVRNEEVNCGE